MPPRVCWSTVTMPPLPVAPGPLGKAGFVARPIWLLHCGLTEDRKSVNAYESPEPSARWMGVIARLGKCSPLLSEVIALSFQLVIWPRKILASTDPVRCRLRMPGTLNPTPVAVSAQGIWKHPLHGVVEADSGASDAPKSTRPRPMSVKPAPEPTAWYVGEALPVDCDQAAAHSASIGATSVDPAPESGAADAAAAVVRPNTAPATRAVHVRLANRLESTANVLSIRDWGRARSGTLRPAAQ